MKYTLLLSAALMVAFASGCGDGVGGTKAPTGTPTEIANYARHIKKMVTDFVADVKRNPKGIYQKAHDLDETLAHYEKQATGDYKEIYANLNKLNKEILAETKDKGATPEVNKKLDEMLALANKLPGEFEKQQK